MDGPAIQADGLGRDYGSTRALESLDLAVPPRAIVGLLGPNGAGKTTTMLLLATLLTPSRGIARVLGHDIVRERRQIRRRLGLVFQEPSIDGLLTIQENLRFAARLAGLDGAAGRRAVDDVLDRTGLAARASQPGRQLSTGWRRLADLARAIVHRPDVLILDEPTVGLDPEHRDRAWSLLDAERSKRGATILFSTHYLTEAEGCDCVVLLAGGRAVGADTPTALRATVGERVVEVEGPDAGRLVSELQDLVDVRVTIKTERGYRVGVVGSSEGLTKLAAFGSRLVRFTVRPATLDDVYFAQTQAAGSYPSAKLVKESA
jgi:ABC-2 type transport system ATP-binding protein